MTKNLEENLNKVVKNQKDLWKPNESDAMNTRRVIGGTTTNIMDLTKIKYKWAKDSCKYQLDNFWVPDKINLQKDILDYKSLTVLEQKVFCNVLSSLSFLDGLQTGNLNNISSYITAPEIKAALQIQNFFEVIHNLSYSQILNTILPLEDLENSLYIWKKETHLYNRNEFLIKNLTLQENATKKDLLRQMISNYALESLSFTAGFFFLYELKVMKGLMKGSTAMIRLIHRDELSHCNLFKDIIIHYVQEEGLENELKNELDKIIPKLVDLQKEWVNVILENNFFVSLNKQNLGSHFEYLASLLYSNLGHKYEKETLKTPLKYLQCASDLEEVASLRSSFFDKVNTSYNLSTALEGLNQSFFD